MRVHIVRHGQTGWNVQRRIQGQLDSELDEHGVQQAKERGKSFADMTLTAAYCSTSIRTRQTIENLLGSRNTMTTYRDDLREVCWGVWQGKYWSDIEAAQPEMVAAYHNALPWFYVDDAELPLQTQARGVAAMENIIKQHEGADEDSNILVVSHGAIMKKMLGYYSGIALTELHRLPALPNCAHCIIEVGKQVRKVTHIASEPIKQTAWSELADC